MEETNGDKCTNDDLFTNKVVFNFNVLCMYTHPWINYEIECTNITKENRRALEIESYIP